ncbi:glycoside hydrolase family 99-like domain-containing protein [Bacillus nitratireducens]|uniref:glycosyltransferase WbsX family protein n=1 Tax=Bacillus nitratireducens TaxID=2026193 RepID=UPI001BA8C603|nr:glycoside hydrolase family 99-like domain-containing protein [Bacillus nitratireducens]QUG87014.1 glycosyl transferase [Bacillus nitratireducens]
MKLIAFYLPQFHEIPENNLWWGKGFTEWTNTRAAQKLFPEHYQPREPSQDYYYDLTDENARKWQAEIAKQYGIYGFCYYHYWFKGKRLLETPFNEVLRTGEPDLPFCLSWANEPWTRRWDGTNNDVLMPQDYGDEEDWKEHFYFLLTAFKDGRYIRIDNKPLFIIYRASIIPRCEEMLLYWQNLAKQNGLEGIYFVHTLNIQPYVKGFDACVEFEPSYTGYLTHNSLNLEKVVDGYHQKFNVMDYDKFWSNILERAEIKKNIKTFLGAFVDWDNSARIGDRALIFKGATPEKFSHYLTQQIKHTVNSNNEFLFINAWNEWGEGAYLEPDKKYGYKYLEAVKKSMENNGFL